MFLVAGASLPASKPRASDSTTTGSWLVSSPRVSSCTNSFCTKASSSSAKPSPNKLKIGTSPIVTKPAAQPDLGTLCEAREYSKSYGPGRGLSHATVLGDPYKPVNMGTCGHRTGHTSPQPRAHQ